MIKKSVLVISSAILLTACFPAKDKPREAKFSKNLTGLWKMNTASTGDNTVVDEGYLLVDNGATVKVTVCKDRSETDAIRIFNNISNFPGLPTIAKTLTIRNNDSMGNSFIETMESKEMRKMTKKAIFDMGTMTINSSILPDANIKNDICTITETVNNSSEYSETFHIVAGYEGDLLDTTIRFVQKVKEGDYDIVASASNNEVEVTLSSDALVGLLGSDEVALSSGTLTVTKHTTVWFNGTLSASLPGGGTLDMTFEAELPHL